MFEGGDDNGVKIGKIALYGRELFATPVNGTSLINRRAKRRRSNNRA